MKTVLALTLGLALADWWAVYRGDRRLEAAAKPFTLLTLMLGFAFLTEMRGLGLWFTLGLALSLAGDVFLLRESGFLAGLAAFLLAHLAYIVGFNTPLPPPNLFSLLMAFSLAIFAARVYRDIALGLDASGLSGLRKPVLAYTLVITVMALSALNTLFRTDWSPAAAGWAALGAVLFFLSDIILAYNRFVRPIRHGRVWNMAAYHLGQMALVWGVWLHLVPSI